MLQVKKYGNRRLYDTEGSRYVTLEEIAERVRMGEDLKVVDAKSGQDLTQVTLAQIILESRGAARLLPVSLLKQLVRMRDDALAEFFGRYIAWALEVYLQLKGRARWSRGTRWPIWRCRGSSSGGSAGPRPRPASRRRPVPR
ncbi:polyhydroxyalkanoate synthesis regulator DNA-binding domain-containing protein [Nannocystis pusilla]|uniref:polyhydroxyalkanoate synthesis regulator DNA-binding domain-containing protein n=1 Tax=Nannocystis pusilla TaxID=889268 RepID=UPI003B76A745